jgi:hypothetical protein
MLIVLFALSSFPVHIFQCIFDFVGLYMRLFVGKRILPQTGYTVDGLGASLSR